MAFGYKFLKLFLLSIPVVFFVSTAPIQIETRTGLHKLELTAQTVQAQEGVRLRDRIDPNSDAFKETPNHYIIVTWRFMRGLINSALVVLLLVAAFSNILNINIDTYTVKKLLPAMVLGVILANLSLFICRMFLDFADVLSATFLNADVTDAAGTAQEIALQILAAIGLGDIQSIGSAGLITSVIAIFGIGATAFFASSWLVVLLLLLIIVGIPTLFLFVLALLFWARGAFLQFLIMMAPVAFFAMAFPFAQQWFKKWWSAWINWVFMKPVVFFLLNLGGVISSQGIGQNLLSWFIGAGLLGMSVTVPFKLSGAVGAFLEKAGNRLAGLGLGATGKEIGLQSKLGASKAAAKRAKILEDKKGKLSLFDKTIGAAFSAGGGAMLAGDFQRRKKAREESILKTYERYGADAQALEDTERLTEHEDAKALEKLALLKDKSNLSDVEKQELAQLKSTASVINKKYGAREPRKLDAASSKIIGTRIMTKAFDDVKYTDTDSVLGFINKEKDGIKGGAIKNFMNGEGHKNTAYENYQAMVVTEKLMQNLRSPTRAEFYDGLQGLEALNKTQTILPGKYAGQTADQLNQLETADKRELATYAYKAAKGRYRLTARPFTRYTAQSEPIPQAAQDIKEAALKPGRIHLSGESGDKFDSNAGTAIIDTENEAKRLVGTLSNALNDVELADDLHKKIKASIEIDPEAELDEGELNSTINDALSRAKAGGKEINRDAVIEFTTDAQNLAKHLRAARRIKNKYFEDRYAPLNKYPVEQAAKLIAAGKPDEAIAFVSGRQEALEELSRTTSDKTLSRQDFDKARLDFSKATGQNFDQVRQKYLYDDKGRARMKSDIQIARRAGAALTDNREKIGAMNTNSSAGDIERDLNKMTREFLETQDIPTQDQKEKQRKGSRATRSNSRSAGISGARRAEEEEEDDDSDYDQEQEDEGLKR
jgi:hypothetical protein